MGVIGDTNSKEEDMKKSFIMSTAIAMMFMAMLFLANGCAKPSHPAGAE
jgi:hypothetical protein